MKKCSLLLLALLVLTCNSDDDTSNPQNCTDVFIFGLKVTLKDAATAAIITDNVSLIAKDGDYEEELIRTENSEFFIGAGEREGNYLIDVISSTHQTYTSQLVRVERTIDNCHVITEALEFVLQPN